MEKIKDLLPIGSVAKLKGAERKIMIIGVKQTNAEKKILYDYLALPYPEGYISPEYLFFVNQEAIEEVYFKGFENEERTEFLEKLEEYYQKKDLEQLSNPETRE